ncbi:hypothetical protein IWQ62_006261 [Dispira parvispora]|uniref:RCK N-terminal domain-containing protein n=1 Tax=Dispira parvispora TaxID=1520584 RepID=A0A9W8AND0_9FUNG|nr:hypothetical protein IWQ62_006261 [Dispira parvispora]
MPRSLNPREEEFFDRVTKRELTPGSTYLGAKLCLRSASTTNTVLTAPIVKAIHKLGAALPHSPFFFTVLNPVDDYHRRNTQILYAKATCEPDAGILNLLSMARGTSSDSTSMERAGDDSHTVVIPDAEEVQATTEANSELCSTFDISQLSLEMPIESIYQSTGMDYTGSEKGKISALSCSGHLVICDYLNQISRQVLPFIRRARVIHNQPQLRVVLITNCPLNKALRKQLKGLGKLDIVRGTPHHANSLHRANVAQALAVVAFHWVDDTLPEVPVAIDDLSRRLREMDPRIPLIRFTSSFIFRCLKPTLEKFHKNPKRRFLEYWGALGSGEGIYMDLGYYLMCTVTNHDSINTILFPLAIPGSSYWTTLNLDQPPFTWSTSGSIGSSVYDDAKLTPTRSVTWEKLTQLLHEKNIVLVGLRRVFLSQKSVPIVAFIPPGSLPLYPKDQVILLVPRSSPLETLQIEL